LNLRCKSLASHIVEKKQIEVEIEAIQGCLPAPIVMRGSSYYCRLDPHLVRFWELQAGDEILITVTKIKRECTSASALK
jgi:hypothetical protein